MISSISSSVISRKTSQPTGGYSVPNAITPETSIQAKGEDSSTFTSTWLVVDGPAVISLVEIAGTLLAEPIKYIAPDEALTIKAHLRSRNENGTMKDSKALRLLPLFSLLSLSSSFGSPTNENGVNSGE